MQDNLALAVAMRNRERAAFNAGRGRLGWAEQGAWAEQRVLHKSLLKIGALDLGRAEHLLPFPTATTA